MERSGRNGSLAVPISLAANQHYFRLRTCQSQKPRFAKVMSNFHVPVWRKFDLKKKKSACLYTCVTVQIRNNKPHNETPTGESWVVSSISPEKLTTSVRKKWRLSVKCSQLFIMCSHKKKKRGGLSFWTTTSQKQEWKTWGEGRGMWCDALSNSCIHSVFLRKRGRGKKREKSGALSQWANFFGFQNASLLRPTNPLRPSMLRVPHKERCADTSARVHTIALANPNIFLLANALSPLARNHTCACSRTHYSEGLHK